MSAVLTRRALLGAALAIALAPRAAPAADPVRVASKPDTEGSLLGSIILAVLGANGVPTENRLGLGPTKIIRAALVEGQIDLYPEYTGNGAFFFQMTGDQAWKQAGAGYDKVKALDLEKNRLVWLKPAPANNTWAITVRRDVAAENRLATMDDFARWVNGGGNVKLAASAEFVESPAALPAFAKAYGFALPAGRIVTLAGGNTAATERAAAEGTSGVNAAMAYGTDGALAELGLVVLKDTKGAQVVYEPAPVVREPVLRQYPQIRTALEPVFETLDGDTLRKLNARIAVGGQDPSKVATDYLASRQLLKQ